MYQNVTTALLKWRYYCSSQNVTTAIYASDRFQLQDIMYRKMPQTLSDKYFSHKSCCLPTWQVTLQTHRRFSPYHADAMHWNVLHGCHNIPEMLQTWCTWYVAASKFKRHLSGTCSILLCPYHVFPFYLSSQFASLFSNSARLLFRWRSR